MAINLFAELKIIGPILALITETAHLVSIASQGV